MTSVPNVEKDAILHKDDGSEAVSVARRVYYEADVAMAVHCRPISGGIKKS